MGCGFPRVVRQAIRLVGLGASGGPGPLAWVPFSGAVALHFGGLGGLLWALSGRFLPV